MENLFLIPELLQIVNRIMGYKDDKNVDKVIKYVIETRFSNEINQQICESVVSELKYRLSVANLSKKNENEAVNALNILFESISYEAIRSEHEEKFNSVCASKDYKKVLKVFNCKSLSTSAGHFFGLDNRGYCDFIIRQLGTDIAQQVIDAIGLYLPDEILR